MVKIAQSRSLSEPLFYLCVTQDSHQGLEKVLEYGLEVKFPVHISLISDEKHTPLGMY